MEREGRSDRQRGYNYPPREMHNVTCSECGKETQVPFKPDGSRPVYCKECYQHHRPKRF
ncbi:MAG: CxxC-x17-CxxC domain-containing protein [Candidatus Thermoplasmatota archaeon]